MAKILKLTYPSTSHTGIDRPLQEDSGNQQTFKISKFLSLAEEADSLLLGQCDQIWRFLKVLGEKVSYKSDPR